MDRVRNYQALEAKLRDIFITRPRDEWLKKLDAADVPHAPILHLDEVLNDPQARQLGIEQTMQHPAEGAVRTIRNPIVYDRQRTTNTAPPTLDEHGQALRAALADAGKKKSRQ
jgi:crotonobetainyl-CoA:carnitine CoA-transferase CaiB-like acyl-CoA transferase